MGDRQGRPRRDILPYRQGELDRLCALYAIINGIRLLLADHHPLSTRQARLLFGYGIDYLDEHGLLAEAIFDGISVGTFIRLARRVASHATNMIPAQMCVTRLFADREEPSSKRVLERLRVVGEKGVVLALLDGAYDHFTVVAGSSETQLQLFDSYGYHRIGLNHCSARAGQARHHIPPASCLLLLLNDRHR